MIASLATGLGVAVAMAAMRGVKVIAPLSNPLFVEMALDGWVIGVTALVASVTPFVFALQPGWLVARGDLGPSLKTSSRTHVGGVHARRGQRALISAELAVALVLIVFAIFFVQTQRALERIPNGFVAEGVLTLRIDLPEDTYDTPASQSRFFSHVVEAVGELRGVQAVGVASFIPVADREPMRLANTDGLVTPDPEEHWATEVRVSAGYRRTLRIPLVAGRDLERHDVQDARAVAVVNETMARRYWGNMSPLGRRVRLGAELDATPWLTVVGVVGDMRNSDVDQPVVPQVYVPYTLAPGHAMAVLVRTEQDPLALAPDVRRAVWDLDPNLPAYGVRSMEQVLVDDLGDGVFLGALLIVLAVVAIGLAASGVYAVLSHVVGQRTAELGMRMALGAQPRRVVALVVSDGLRYGAIGLGVGLVGALAVGRLLEDQLYGVNTSDPATFVGSVLLLLVITVAASWLPARSAARLSPLVAIRME